MLGKRVSRMASTHVDHGALFFFFFFFLVFLGSVGGDES